jgi:flagellar biosynthesis protein FlhA
MQPAKVRGIVERVRRKLDKTPGSAVALAGSGARHFLRQVIEPAFPNLAVLSHNEIPAEVTVRSLGVID